MLTEDHRDRFSKATGIWNPSGISIADPDDVMPTHELLEDFVSQWGSPDSLLTTFGKLYTWRVGRSGRLFFMDFGDVKAAYVKLR